MIRQAHTYLVGAVSGTALIAAAVVAFVLLVSFQALRDWPLAGLSIGGDESAVSVPSSRGADPTAGNGQATAAPAPGAAGAAGGEQAKSPPASRAARTQGTQVATGTTPAPPASAPVAKSPASNSPSPGAGNGSSPSGSSSSGGNGAGGGSSESGTPSTSGAVTGAVKDTVAGADEATGGVVGSTGVTEVTEEAVPRTVGPESAIGRTVDETVKTVGGLVGG